MCHLAWCRRSFAFNFQSKKCVPRNGSSVIKTIGIVVVAFWFFGQGHVAVSSEIFAMESAHFINIQRDNYNSILTGQNRLKRACSVPVTPPISQEDQLPNLSALETELNTEAQRFKSRASALYSAAKREQALICGNPIDKKSRASALYSAAKREQALICGNPIDKLFELFGAKSACAEAKARTRSTQKILKSASDWEAILKFQMKVLNDVRSLETRACLSSGFTTKLTQAYIDSIRPQDSTHSTLFDRWTSAE